MHSLSSVGIYYLHEGAALGGKLAPVGLDEKIGQLAHAVKSGGRICLMCSEHKNPAQCHRTTVLKPVFAKHGIEVIELTDFHEI